MKDTGVITMRKLQIDEESMKTYDKLDNIKDKSNFADIVLRGLINVSNETTVGVSPLDSLTDEERGNSIRGGEVSDLALAAALIETHKPVRVTNQGIFTTEDGEALTFEEEKFMLASNIEAKFGVTIPGNTAREVMKALEYRIMRRAKLTGNIEEVNNGFAKTDNGTAVDMGSTVIEVTRDGWKPMEGNAPIFFRGVVKKDAEVAQDNKYTDDEAREEFLSLIAMTEDSRSAAWGWALSFITNPSNAKPAIFMAAQGNSGKTSAAKAISLLFSSREAMVTMGNLTENGLANTTRGTSIVTLDNISGIRASVSDELAAAITGNYLRKRVLHTDNGVYEEKIMLGIIFTTTAVSSLREDLQQRLLTLNMVKTEKMSEEEWLTKLNNILPYARRALFNDAVNFMNNPVHAENSTLRMKGTSDTIAWADKKRGTNALNELERSKKELAMDALPTWAETIVEYKFELNDASAKKAKDIMVEKLSDYSRRDADYVSQLSKVKFMALLEEHLKERDDCSLDVRLVKKQKLYTLTWFSDSASELPEEDFSVVNI